MLNDSSVRTCLARTEKDSTDCIPSETLTSLCASWINYSRSMEAIMRGSTNEDTDFAAFSSKQFVVGRAVFCFLTGRCRSY